MTPPPSEDLPLWWNWKKPDYSFLLQRRYLRLEYLRESPERLEAAKEYYRDDHFVEFIRDWGMMRDPRRASDGGSVVIPFVPFPRQIELLHWIHSLVLAPSKGLLGRGNVDKTRDCGFSWCCVAYACWRFLFFKNNDIGFGSSLERNVYDLGNPKSIFFKIQSFLDLLPEEFQPLHWDSKRNIQKGAGAGKAINPETNSTITGDCGDDVGRGGRTLLYFVDEHASIERPLLAEAGLSENTNTQINGSTHKGPGTLFYKQCATLRAGAPSRLFEFNWSDDPRRDQDWYDQKKNDPMTDPVIFAQEVDRDPSASISDGFLNIEDIQKAQKTPPEEVYPAGPYIISIDVAHMGNDKSIVAVRRGNAIYPLHKFRKKEADQLAGEVQRICRKLLEKGTAPIGAIIYELAGPGYGFHAMMKSSPYKKLLRPINPGTMLNSAEFFNERARCWGLFKEWLEEGGKSLPDDRELRELGAALRYTHRAGKRGTQVLLLEDKKEFKARMAADPRNKASGPSPDEADAVALGFSPVKLDKFSLSDLRRESQWDEFSFPRAQGSWGILDPKVGY